MKNVIYCKEYWKGPMDLVKHCYKSFKIPLPHAYNDQICKISIAYGQLE